MRGRPHILGTLNDEWRRALGMGHLSPRELYEGNMEGHSFPRALREGKILSSEIL